jgi:hypothetical protein
MEETIMDKNKQNTASNSSSAQGTPKPEKPSLGQRILGLFHEPPPPDYKPPAPGLPPREVFMPGRAPFRNGPYLFTDIRNGRTTFDPGQYEPDMLPMTIDTLTKAVRGSKKGADAPYSTRNIVGTMHRGNDVRYGVDGAYIKTGDSRGRDVHGGGSGLHEHYKDPNQPLIPTAGCTRGHNQDIINLGNRIKEFQQAHPGVPIPYDRR